MVLATPYPPSRCQGCLSEKRQRNVTNSSRLLQVADVLFGQVYSMAAQDRQAANIAPQEAVMLSNLSLVTPAAVAELDLCGTAGLTHAGTGGQDHESALAAVTRPDGVGLRPPAAGVWAWGGWAPWRGSPGRSRLATSTRTPPSHSRPGNAWPRRGHDRRLRCSWGGDALVQIARSYWEPTARLMISLIIFFAALLSSTVGFAFSAIAGALILHYVTDGVEAVQIMMIASIGIQAYSVACLWCSIQWERCRPFMAGGVAPSPAASLSSCTCSRARTW